VQVKGHDPEVLCAFPRSGQVISSRVDLFPKQYITKLQKLQDSVDPIPVEVVKTVISQELLEGESLDLLFREFDDKPLGSASIAQVMVLRRKEGVGERALSRGDLC
jgi:predicted unusual protein kinase regulating ubiquinone biosynthesis (AarF/ABC1/UbiB family)